MNLSELGARIRLLREQRGLKQRDVANALQISAQAVSKWERGDNAPDIALLLDLSKLLGVSCDTLLGRKDQTDDTFPATVFCTGLNRFAVRAAELKPRDVASWANGLFHLVTEAVVKWDGVPIKYVGDGFLGFFSGPNHASRALEAALETKLRVPTPDLVVALHSGDIYLGLIGHREYARLDIIGDAVNTAFLAMHWTADHVQEGLGATEAVIGQLQGGRFVAGQPREAWLKPIGKRLRVYVPKVAEQSAQTVRTGVRGGLRRQRG